MHEHNNIMAVESARMDAALAWVIIGGLLEPLWVIGLKKFNDTRSVAWGVFAVVIMFVSPGVLAFAMQDMAVGVAYSIWTGIGAVTTLIAGMLVFHERIGRLKVLFVFLIIAGVVGLELSSEVMA